MKKKTDFNEKPYNKCFSCPHRLTHGCDGPRTAPMPLDVWCEYMRGMKEANGLTNADIAERSGISVKRVEQLMALNSDQDIMRDTARRIENAIIGSANQYPCYLVFEESTANEAQKLTIAAAELERALADNKDIRTALDNIHASYNAEIQAVRDEAQKKADYLLNQVERLRGEIDYLRLENDRKARIIDKFLER